MRLFGTVLRINSLIDPTCRVEKLSRQIRFIVCELKTIVGEKRDPVEKLRILLWFLFEYKKFKVKADEASAEFHDLMVNSVLENKNGLPLPIAILIQEISAEIGVKLDFISYHGFRLLKLVHKGKSFFLDVADKRLLTVEEVLKLLNTKQIPPESKTKIFEVTQPQLVLRSYLENLKAKSKKQKLTQPLLHIYDLILEHYPTSFRELAERALLLKEIGQNQLAQIDLRRYFSFVSFDKAPEKIKKIHEELRSQDRLELI